MPRNFSCSDDSSDDEPLHDERSPVRSRSRSQSRSPEKSRSLSPAQDSLMSSPDPTTDKNCIKLGGEKSRSMQSEIDSSNRDPSPKSSQGHRHQRRQCSSDRGDRDRPKTDKSNVMDLNTPNVFNFRACTPDESKALLETLVHKHERVERSAHQVIALNKTSTFAGVKARVWNAVRHKPLGQPKTTWFSNTAVSALNKLGTWDC